MFSLPNFKSTNLNEVRRKISNSRKLVEQSRMSNLRNIEEEVKKIIEKEKEYSLTVLEEIIPVNVNVNINKDVLESFKSFIPITVEIKKKEEATFSVNTVVSVDESSEEYSDEELDKIDINNTDFDDLLN